MPMLPTFYRLLVRLYPKAFREQFGEEMQQVFRDQSRAAAKEARTLQLCFLTLGDLSLSLPRQHFQELKKQMNLQSLSRNLSFVRLFVAIAVCLIAFVIITIYLLPRTYQGVARMAVMPAATAEKSPASYDPYHLQIAMELLKSRQVLLPVIEELGLQKRLGEFGTGTPLTTEQAYTTLLNMLTLRQSRNTALMEIRVYSEDPRMSAEIANKITEVFLRHEVDRHRSGAERSALFDLRLIDQATPVTQAIRPNIPLNIVLGSTVSLLLAILIAAFTRLFLRGVASSR